MILVHCPECQASYRVRNDLAGMEIRCHECRFPVVVPRDQSRPDPEPEEAVSPRESLSQAYDRRADPFQQDHFLIPRPSWSSAGREEICDAGGRPVLFLDRPARFKPGAAAGCLAGGLFFGLIIASLYFAVNAGFNHFEENFRFGAPLPLGGALLKAGLVFLVGFLVAAVVRTIVLRLATPRKRLRFYADRGKRDLLVEVEGRRGDFICSSDGEVLGKFRLAGGMGSYLRKSWTCRDADGEVVAVAREDSIHLSILRRTFGHLVAFVPGGYILAIPQRLFGSNLGLMPTNFLIYAPDGQTLLGTFSRGLTVLKPYRLDLKADAGRELDRRLLLALAVVVDIDERG
jgi:predicted Zn finger-like uncharacterized protein